MPEFICPSCNTTLKLGDQHLGRRVRCRCGFVFRTSSKPAESEKVSIHDSSSSESSKKSAVGDPVGQQKPPDLIIDGRGEAKSAVKEPVKVAPTVSKPDPVLIDPWASHSPAPNVPVSTQYSAYPPPQPVYHVAPVSPYYHPPKSRVVAGLLGLFLGCWGIHNFYLGHVGLGVAQICLTVIGIVTACLFFGIVILIVVSLWTFIESILCFAGARLDSEGRMLV